jgi:Beta protein
MKRVIYSPILKSKRGEAKSLQHLSASVKSRIIPFFDILALKADTQNGSDVEAHLIKQALTIASGWKQQGVCYVDLFDVNPSARALAGVHPVHVVHTRLAAEQVRAIPVVGLERDVHYKLAIRAVVADGAEALAIRLEAEDIQLPSVLAGRVTQLVGELGAASIPIHLFCDFRSIAGQSPEVLRAQFLKAYSELAKTGASRVVFAASAMVQNMGSYKRDSFNRVPRVDYLAWQSIVKVVPTVDYSDYGVVHPDYIDLDPRIIKPSAKIRYSTDREWLIVKGSRWADNTAQHHRLSQVLQGKPEFRGADCWGADYIVTAAAGRKTYGALETWVTIDQNTHITHTVNHLTKVVAPQLAVAG